MQVDKLVFNSFSVNTYIVSDETGEAIIIDPGCHSDSEKESMVKFLKDKNLKPVKIVNTHCHIDHILGVDFLKDTYGLDFYACKNDEYLFDFLQASAQMFGFYNVSAPKIDAYVAQNDYITFGNSKLKVLEVPGHTAGHVAFYSEVDKFVIVGDVLFKGSIGRTDLPGGDLDELIDSIRNKLFPLGDECVVFPGHGDETNIGGEVMYNPFLRFDE